MRLVHTLSAALFLSSAAWALPTFPVVFQDVLDSQNSSDVIGSPDLFEIDYLRLKGLNGNSLEVEIRFNFGGGTALNGFAINDFSPTLNVGDLFFRTAGNTYAFVLHGHNGLATNGLYQISATQSARTVLGNPSGNYRPDAQVWADPNGAQLLGTGSASITTVNNVNTHLLASLLIPLSNTVIGDLDNGFGVYFASATCGNDEIIGRVPESGVPEPGTWALIGLGLTGVGLIRRKR